MKKCYIILAMIFSLCISMAGDAEALGERYLYNGTAYELYSEMNSIVKEEMSDAFLSPPTLLDGQTEIISPWTIYTMQFKCNDKYINLVVTALEKKIISVNHVLVNEPSSIEIMKRLWNCEAGLYRIPKDRANSLITYQDGGKGDFVFDNDIDNDGEKTIFVSKVSLHDNLFMIDARKYLKSYWDNPTKADQALASFLANPYQMSENSSNTADDEIMDEEDFTGEVNDQVTSAYDTPERNRVLTPEEYRWAQEAIKKIEAMRR